MNVVLLERPLFYVAGHYVSFLGVLAFAGFFAAGLFVAKILSVSALVFFTVSAVNWTYGDPRVRLR